MEETYQVPRKTIDQVAGALAVAIAILSGIEANVPHRQAARQQMLDAAWKLDDVVQEQT